jgi:hypothetical protein
MSLQITKPVPCPPNFLSLSQFTYLSQAEEDGDPSSAANRNIWEEGEDHSGNIIVKPVENDPGMEIVMAGSLNKLVERLTKDKGLAAKFRDTFLLT